MPATAYTPTTTQAITNYIPVLQTAAAGVARFDHNPTTGESLGLLVEEQRTNLLTYSEQFDNAAWTKSNATVTANAVVAPDGTLTADLAVPNGAQPTLGQNATLTATAYAFSVYIKAAGIQFIQLRNNIDTGYANFDLVAGVVGGKSADWTSSIHSVGNGWYRCIAVTDTQTAGSTGWRIQFIDSAIHPYGGSTVVGDGYSGIYIWGAQLEAGAFPTSYIKTEASQVTRSADAASMTGANFSSWYRADEGTLYAEGLSVGANASTAVSMLASVNDGTINNATRITMLKSPSAARVSVNGVNQCDFSSAYTAGNTRKVAIAYKTNDFAAAFDGATAQTDASGSIPLVNQIQFGNWTSLRELNGTIRKISYYPARLPNATLQAITA